MSFPAYTAYKDSGAEWLGKVPTHWSVHRVSELYREVAEPGHHELPILSVSIHDGVSNDEAEPDEEGRKVNRSDDRSKYKQVKPNDLVYNMMRAWQGGFGSVKVLGMVSPAYVVARPRDNTPSGLVELMLRTSGAIEEMRRRSKGVTDFRLRLYWEEFKDMRIALPPAREQFNILAFLNRETAKIDALVEEQRRLIALLKEKRQAVISHTVTKGLNPDALMKDCGVEWLGKVPEHWDVKPLKHLIQLRSGGTPSKDREDFWDGAIPWASAKDLKGETLYDTLDHITELAVCENGIELAPAGSILVLVRGMMLARAFPVLETRVAAAINQDLKAITVRPAVNGGFIAWTLRGAAQESLDRCAEAGHGTKALRMDAWLSMPIACPPLAEQSAIVRHLEGATSRIDELIAEAGRSIALLDERRSALISAAVTGKIDVCGSAKLLPFPLDRTRARRLIAAEIIYRSAHQATFGRTKLQKLLYLAEAHANVNELAGRYVRMPYGPLDQDMIDEIESAAADMGFAVDDPGNRKMVRYRPVTTRSPNRNALAEWLGDNRVATLDKLITDFANLNTHAAEAVATLYAVWNDALIDGETPSDDWIVNSFLTGWNKTKAENFDRHELPRWLDWMRRHGLIPTGAGPKTSIGGLFT